MKHEGPLDIEALTKVMGNVTEELQVQLLQLFHTSARRVIMLAGPTGVGKTALSIALAKKLNGEIISADSVQVYRGMDVGTAKIPVKDQQGIPHHLIDIRNVCESYNVVNFYEDAKAAAFDILRRNKVPIVVGGTGFYLHALIYGPPRGPPEDPKIRKALEEDFEKFGIEPLFQKLQEFDKDENVQGWLQVIIILLLYKGRNVNLHVFYYH
jgi:tRNA dimethylallyltransferase